MKTDAAPTIDGLELVAGFISVAQRSATEAAMLAEEDDPGRHRLAVEMAKVAATSAANALAHLGNMGVRPARLPRPAPPVPLELLDTPDTRRLLYLLEHAQEVAERIDAERDRALDEGTPLFPGESRGTDLAETISEIALRVRIEINGPKGSGGKQGEAA